ncbi:Histone-lysine N-methyltransferase NSD3, partial [Nowakowskiella sp. JEL0078]
MSNNDLAANEVIITVEKDDIKIPKTPINSNFQSNTGPFKINDLVWAKVKGYRWWPAKIQSLDLVPTNIFNVPHKEGSHPIRFYGTKEYGWCTDDKILPYETNKLKLSGKPISKDFKLALNEIESTPEILDYVFELVDVPNSDPSLEPKTPPPKKSRASVRSISTMSVNKESGFTFESNPSTTTKERRRKSAHRMNVGSDPVDEELLKPMKRA